MPTALSLTVAIPTYNAGNDLLRCVESCRCLEVLQTDLEVLVIDNCSTDGSVERLREEHGDLAPLRIVRNEANCGRVSNWNRCLDLARHDVLLVLFASDLISPDNDVAGALALLSEEPRCALVSGPFLESDYALTSLALVGDRSRCLPHGYYRCSPFIRSRVEAGRLPFVPLQANFLRLDLVSRHGLRFDPKLPVSGDGLFLSQLAESTGTVGFVAAPSIIWRASPKRTHAGVTYDLQTMNALEAFVRISRSMPGDQLDLVKAYANYQAPEYALELLITARRRNDLKRPYRVLRAWLGPA